MAISTKSKTETTSRSAPTLPDSVIASEPRPTGKNRPIGLILGAVVLAAAVFGYRTWSFNQSHAVTDDAAIAASVVQISPQISGTVSQVLVGENEVVKKGQLLAVIDDTALVATIRQAQASLDSAIAEATTAGVSVKLTADSGNAQVQQAQGVLGQAIGGVSSARALETQAQAGIRGAEAAKVSAIANAAANRSSVDSAIASRNRASASVESAISGVDVANATVTAASAAVATAQASEDFASQEDERYAALLAQGVATAQTAQSKASAHRAAQAQLDAAKQGEIAARAQARQRQMDVRAARDELSALGAAVVTAQAQARLAQSQAAGSDASVQQAQSQRDAAIQAVVEARAKEAQARGQVSQAATVGVQVEQSKSAQTSALAKIEIARTALDAAKLQLSYTRIVAPLSGRVSKKSIDVGEQVQPGMPLMGIVDESNVWVVANFKETQLPGLEALRHADVEIDGLPGRTFTGHVESVSAGTGSTFALLPPDNASGNFTKVVQRIPVKIVFDPGQKDLDKLRVGMSATSIVTVR